ncbi:phage protein Gp36 family protein [Sphingobacterium cellulitidis]|uniref:phage protein Gp36 family protein n=1 Tax=Sphingobacterium cellulitidis TaxID=1768011 RepID=UPI003C7B3355
MGLITPEDFYTHMYSGTIEAISDGNEESLAEAIDTAISEAFGYLSRFDLDAIMTSDDRKTYANLRTWLKDIAKWHFINICNVATDLELAKERYDDAITRLKDIQKGIVTPKGWALPQDENDQSGAFTVSSRPKRENYY